MFPLPSLTVPRIKTAHDFLSCTAVLPLPQYGKFGAGSSTTIPLCWLLWSAHPPQLCLILPS